MVSLSVFRSIFVPSIKRLLHRPGPVILMYHRIADDRFDPWGLCVPAPLFREQLTWLVAHRRILPLEEFADLHAMGRLPTDAVSITFDDGYAETIQTALPILRELGCQATLFLATDLLDEGREFWWDDLQRIILESQKDSLSSASFGVEISHALGKPDDADWNWPSWNPPRTARQAAFQAIWSLLLTLAPNAREVIIEDLREQAGVSACPRPGLRPLSEIEAASLPTETFRIGAHSASHRDLSSCKPKELRQEIQASLTACEEIIGTRPTSFAYPYGIHTEEAAIALSHAGLHCACTVEAKPITRRTPLMFLPRLGVGRWSAKILEREIARL